MTYRRISVVIPVYRQADHIGRIVSSYREVLEKVPLEREVIVVPNGPDEDSRKRCLELAELYEDVLSVDSPPGWGEAVQAGLAVSTGDLLCYTNSARTTAEDLLLTVFYAVSHPGVVIKASRNARDTRVRRLGSMLYNLECRILFDLANFDVNGTPKLFPREFSRLLALARRDDLIDLEFNVICRLEGYPMLEVPIASARRHGGRSTTGYRSALRMYVGAVAIRRKISKVDRAPAGLEGDFEVEH